MHCCIDGSELSLFISANGQCSIENVATKFVLYEDLALEVQYGSTGVLVS